MYGVADGSSCSSGSSKSVDVAHVVDEEIDDEEIHLIFLNLTLQRETHIYHIMSLQICARQTCNKRNTNIGSCHGEKLNQAVVFLCL